MLRKLAVSIIFVSLFLGSQALADEIEGLVLYFPFDEGSGDVVRDASGNGNNGEITGAEWADGKIGKALEFDGASFVEVPSSDSLEGLEEGMTVVVWINPELTGSVWQGIVTKGNDAIEHFELLINVDGHVHTAQMFEQGRVVADRPSPGSVVAGEWQHLAVTYRPEEWVLYIDGEVQDTNTAANTNLIPDGNPVVIGDERPMSRLFEGLIDEVAIFSRAVSAEEVQLIMSGIGNIMSVELLGKITTTWANIKR